MMDDIAEQQDVAREISDAISNPVAFGADLDDEDLERNSTSWSRRTLIRKSLAYPSRRPHCQKHSTEDLPEKAKEKKKATTTTAVEDDGEFSHCMWIYVW